LLAVIMAGGKGTRLRPLTCQTPKSLIPVLGKPVMAYSLDLLSQYGFSDIAVTLQHLPGQIQNCFSTGEAWEVKLHYFEETVPLGTAGGVKNASALATDTFLVISGDALTDFNLEEALQFHRTRGAVATLVLTRVDNPLEYGVVITSRDGRIERFVEKPGWGEVFSDTVNTGIYILEPEVLGLIPDGTFFDFSRDLFPLLLSSGRPFFGFVASGYWCDIGDLQQYRQTNFDVLSGRVGVAIPGVLIGDRVWAGGTNLISPSAHLVGPAFIGANCVIEAGAGIGEFTVLGSGTVVEAGADIKKSIIWEHSCIGQGAELRGATVGRRVRIGTKASLYEGTVLADDVAVQTKGVVQAGARVWPEKVVEQGTVVRRSMIWGDRQGTPLFGQVGVCGTLGAELTLDMLVRLGAAFGSGFSPGVTVAVSSDGDAPADLALGSITAGIRGTGVHVLNLGTAPVPVARFTVRAMEAAGGVCIQSSVWPSADPKLVVQFLDGNGVNLDRVQERRVENCYRQEDLRWVPGPETGRVITGSAAADRYHRELLARVGAGCADTTGLLTMALAGREPDVGLMAAILEARGFRVDITGDEPGSPEFARSVAAGRAALGVEIFNSGEQLGLLTETGCRLTGEQILGLTVMASLTREPLKPLAVPAHASMIVEMVADQLGGRVVRTKVSRAAVMAADNSTGGMPFHPLFDAYSTMLLVLDLTTRRNLPLTELAAGLPAVHYRSWSVPCPWSAKGRIMRRLYEMVCDQRIELLDGVKLFLADGWALVIPDADGPFLQVYAEATSAVRADQILAEYADRVTSLLEQSG